MAEAKTKPTKVSAESFLNTIDDEQARKDSFTLIKLMEKITGEPPVMWGPAIIGFGKYHYKYASGHEGDICLTGFSPRKGKLSLYTMAAFEGRNDLLTRLGKHKGGKGCLSIKKLDDVDMAVLETLIIKSIEFLNKKIADYKVSEK
jgi:hypothetical protein